MRQRREPRRQHIANLAEAYRANGGERRQLPQHAQHALRLRNHSRRQPFERLQPVAPDLRRRPLRHLGEDRLRKRSQRPQLLAITHQAAHPRRIRILGAGFANATVVLMLQALEPALPAIEPANHRGFDDQVFPAPRRAQGAGDDLDPSRLAWWPPVPLLQAGRLQRGLPAAIRPRRARRLEATTNPHRWRRSAAPGPATRIPQIAAPTTLRQRMPAGRGGPGRPDRDVECRDGTTRECRRDPGRARARRGRFAERAAAPPSDRRARRARLPATGVARSQPLRGLRPVLKTAPPTRPVHRSAALRWRINSVVSALQRRCIGCIRCIAVHRVHRVHRVQVLVPPVFARRRRAPSQSPLLRPR